ncbi:hypothetical protein MMC30_004567 [Trapelia coarctata]|nr:hypothetical protein [Trapelia coarctata]
MSRTSADLTALRAPPAAGAEAEATATNSTLSVLANGGPKKANGEKETDGEKAKPPNKAGKQKASQAKPIGDAVGKEAGKKLTNAELKIRAKADKAAKRAQAKEGKSEAVLPDLSSPRKVDTAPEGKRNNSSGGGPGTPALKAHHKQTTSISRNIPMRPTSQPQIVEPAPQPEKENKTVALFGHLYSQPRRTTIGGAGKDVHPAVLALGLQMSNYVVCGSNARCVSMLLVFKRVIESYVTPPKNSLPRHLTSHLSSQIEYLVSCRPLSVSMGNAIRWLKVEINNVDPDTDETEAKEGLCDAIDNFIREKITAADQLIATSAAEKIQDGDVILTFAKSSIVQKSLVEAFRNGKKFRVIVVDSRPLFEGMHLARALAGLGLQVQYSLTHAIAHTIKDASKVFLGAHAMMSNGRLYSRVGTAIVAMMAKESDVPVIVCCEGVKFTDKVALDSIVANEVAPPDELVTQGEHRTALTAWHDSPNLQLLNLMYDVTPAEYISMVVTEFGSLPPSSVPVVHRLSTNT